MAESRGEASPIPALLAAWRTTPAIARDRHLTIVAANTLAQALSPDYRQGVNLARAAFLATDPARRDDTTLSLIISLLHDSLDEYQEDEGFVTLIGELMARSAEFARLWSTPDEVVRHTGTVRHPETAAGAIALLYQELRMPLESDCVIVVFRPADERSAARLDRLAAAAGQA